MIGTIIGDVAGSRFERWNCKSKDFELLAINQGCRATDDSIMTLALCQAILDCNENYDLLKETAIQSMQKFGRIYPHCGFGRYFLQWVLSNDPQPYGSYGNGAAMRVGGCGWAAKSLKEAVSLSHIVTGVTHNHPEAYKAAAAISSAIFLGREGKSMEDIRGFIEDNYYSINFTIDEIRDTYEFDVSCQGSVPQAFEAFFESICFEDAIRNAISIGGDSDTIGAITGSIAEAYYGVPKDLRKEGLIFLGKHLRGVLDQFEKQFPPKIEEMGSLHINI